MLSRVICCFFNYKFYQHFCCCYVTVNIFLINCFYYIIQLKLDIYWIFLYWKLILSLLIKRLSFHSIVSHKQFHIVRFERFKTSWKLITTNMIYSIRLIFLLHLTFYPKKGIVSFFKKIIRIVHVRFITIQKEI